MGLSTRKEKILQAVVDSYINSCEPISSGEIQEHHLPMLSTATIRSELVKLEEMGYLAQPHTSSGRIPTAEAYKLYVEKLMPIRKLNRAELKTVKRYFNSKLTELDDILKSTAKVLTEITNLTSVAYSQNDGDAVIQNIKMVKVTDTTALVIVVTNLGILKDAAVSVNASVSDDYFATASKFVTDCFAGYSITEILKPKAIIREIKREYEQVYKTVLKILKSYSQDEMISDIVLEGSSKILEQPEYANLQKAKAMLEILDAKEQLIPVLNNNNSMNLNITIGKDNEIREGMPECAIVTASYSVNGVNIGKAGVIGPIRMDYPKVISVLDYIGRTINLLPDRSEEKNKNAQTDDLDDDDGDESE